MALQLPVPPRDRLPKEAGNEQEEKVEPKIFLQGKGTPSLKATSRGQENVKVTPASPVQRARCIVPLK